MSPSAPRTYRGNGLRKTRFLIGSSERPKLSKQNQAGRQKRGYSKKSAKEKDIQSGARASRMPSAHLCRESKDDLTTLTGHHLRHPVLWELETYSSFLGVSQHQSPDSSELAAETNIVLEERDGPAGHVRLVVTGDEIRKVDNAVPAECSCLHAITDLLQAVFHFKRMDRDGVASCDTDRIDQATLEMLVPGAKRHYVLSFLEQYAVEDRSTRA